MKKKKLSEFDRFTKMNREELARETAQFNGPIKTVKPTAEDTRKLNKFYGRGRPKHGKNGTKMVAVSIEKKLLADFDRVAKRTGVKRSEVFARAIRDFVAAH